MPTQNQLATSVWDRPRVSVRPELRERTVDPAPNNGRRTVLLCSALYVATFYWAYATTVVPIYRYEGYGLRTEPWLLLATFVLALLPAINMPEDFARPSQVAYWVLYLLVIVPTAIVPPNSLKSGGALGFSAVLVLMFMAIGLVYRAPIRRSSSAALEPYQFSTGILIISAVFYGIAVIYFGIHFELSLLKVYDLRSTYQDTLGRSNIVVAYAIAWQCYVLNPYMMARGFVSKNIVWFVLGVVGQALLYSITGYKTVFFSGLFVMVLAFMLRSGGRRFGPKLASAMAALLALSTLSYKVLGFGWLVALFSNRMISMTGLLTGFYYEFFSTHPKAMLAHSILGRFITYPYSLEPPRLIGLAYFHSAGTSANANFLADAYANFGYTGVVLFSVLLALVLWFYDKVSLRADRRMAALVLAMPAIALSNSALLTTLLTHGIGFAILLVLLMPPEAERTSRQVAPRFKILERSRTYKSQYRSQYR